jgi:hypothetical protein
MPQCRHCQREFAKESTLAAHSCEQKLRHQQQNETGVQFGFKAYLRFYETTQGSARLKTYEDFSNSAYYRAFVKYGRHCVAIRAINFSSFTDWLLKNNKKLDHWCKDSLYEEWLSEYIRRESPQDALERALKEMQEYADSHPELKNGFREYFKFGNVNRVCYHISTGRISPWIVFNCSSGVEFLDGLDTQQISLIIAWIDPDYWQKKFKDYLADTEWVKDILHTTPAYIPRIFLRICLPTEPV